MTILDNIEIDPASQCPCGSAQNYENCCQPLHQGKAYAITAEELMRSRFTAFKLGLAGYLEDTWDEASKPQSMHLDPDVHWVKLSINGRKKGRKKDNEGWVTFVAYYEAHEQAGMLHEKSYFRRDSQNHWRYVDGEIKSQ